MTSDHQANILNIPGYEIIRPIGQGGMGEVYLARQLSLGRPVAVKLLSLVSRSDPAEQIARFRREAELMARVQHPNVVPVHDSGTIDGRPYLVMEYIEGGDLRRRMEPGRPLPSDQVRPLVLPVAQALSCLHAHNIVHRDLKPENILLHHGYTPMLTDFGIAVLDTEAGSLRRTDGVMGTPGYVAPEQQYGLGVDERADQYSMAAVIYELLTGHRPLGMIKPPTELSPGLGPRVDSVLLRALEEDPDDRYPTVQEFGVAMDRALFTPEAEIEVHPRRRPLGTATASLAVMALAVVAAVAGFRTWKGRLVAPAGGLPAGPLAAAAPAPGPVVAPVPAPAPAPAPAPVPAPIPEQAALGPPPRLINIVGMTLVLVPAGEFPMGSPDSDAAAMDNEKPRHQVRISRPFYMGAHEVSVRQFRAFVLATGYRTEAEASGKGGTVYHGAKKGFEQNPDCNWRNPGLPRPQSDDEPVVQVSLNDATAFCRWLSGQDHRNYRLPTEAEWERACRANSTTRWCMGDDSAQLDEFAWARDDVGCTTHPVGGKKPNAFGLYDMHGNVWEWCLDRLRTYSNASEVNPSGALTGVAGVLRGGACARGEVDRTRSAMRLKRKPSYRFSKSGFRVCCPLVEKAVGP